MHNQPYDWHTILREVGVRHHPVYHLMEAADFAAVVGHFSQDNDPFATLADYLLYGAAAVLGRHQKHAETALAYHARLNAKTKAVSLFFWAEEAVAHMQYRTAEGFVVPLLESYPNDPELNALFATCCLHQQDTVRGRPTLNRGLKAAPEHAGLNSLLCRYLLADGELVAAEDAARHLLELDPFNAFAFNVLSRVSPGKVDDRLLERFEHRALEGSAGPANSASMLFDIGRIYDARGTYERAFDAIVRANDQMKSIPQMAGHTFDGEQEFRQFEDRCRLFDQLSPYDQPTELTPVFIIGLPRTGSTLLDQALAAHPSAVSLGENDIIPTLASEAEDLLRQGDIRQAQAKMPEWRSRFFEQARRQAVHANGAEGKSLALQFVVDKMLGNSRHLGFLAKLFPEAVILHSSRNIMDVGLSIYFSPLHRANIYATDLQSIGDFIYLEERIMAFWNKRGFPVLPVAYEMMVDDMERVLRQVTAHIGMDWHQDCLEFNKQKRAVHTYSAHQVRKALYRSSKGRWQHYRAQMTPLKKALKSRGINAESLTA